MSFWSRNLLLYVSLKSLLFKKNYSPTTSWCQIGIKNLILFFVIWNWSTMGKPPIQMIHLWSAFKNATGQIIKMECPIWLLLNFGPWIKKTKDKSSFTSSCILNGSLIKSSDWFLKDHLEQRFAPEFNFKSNWLLQIGDTQILQCWIFTNFIEF